MASRQPEDSDVLVALRPGRPRGELLAALDGDGRRLRSAQDVETLRAAATEESPDLVVLDAGLDGGEVRELCRELRHPPVGSGPPVMIVDEGDAPDADRRLAWYAAGADDVVGGALDPREVAARCAVLLRWRRHTVELERLRIELERMSSHDPLTQLVNHRAFHEALEREFSRAERYRSPVSVVLIDLDDLEKVNEGHGHEAGDGVLRQVASVLSSAVRMVDTVARYSGGRFALILPETDTDGAHQVAERVRGAVGEQTFEEVIEANPCPTLTASLGIASFPGRRVESARNLIELADQALYQAKQSGRNCTVAYGCTDVLWASPAAFR